jgi:hypothetical protein
MSEKHTDPKTKNVPTGEQKPDRPHLRGRARRIWEMDPSAVEEGDK